MKRTEKMTSSKWVAFSRKAVAFLLAVMCVGLLFSQTAAAEEAVSDPGQEQPAVLLIQEEQPALEGEEIDTVPDQEELSDEEPTQETTQELTEEPTEVTTEEPTEISTEEPTEVTTEEPTEISTEEPAEETSVPEEEPVSISEEIEDTETVIEEEPEEETVLSEEIVSEEQTGTADELQEELQDTETEELEAQEDRETLSYGMTGSDVLKMQKALKELNYLYAVPDGIFGGQSLMAVKRFQLFNGLSVTGEADKATLTVLYEGTPAAYQTLWKGMSGTAVYNIQQFLFGAGFLPCNPDGIFGNYSAAAVKAYQAQAGLASPDGGVGNWTTAQMADNPILFEPLGYGSSGNAVKVLQQQLTDLGFLSVTPDGIFGGYSQRAVKKFQMYAGLAITGLADVATVNAIYRGDVQFSTLSKGSGGRAVLALQKLLQDLGYLNVTPDGGYGNYTVQAVKAFQKANGITQDGACGKVTTEALFSDPISAAEYSSMVTVGYGGTYIIKTALGNTVLDLTDASVYAGANVQMYTGNDSGAQKWVMQSAGGEYYYIRNLRSWKVLDMVDGNVQQSYADSSSQTQKWKIVKLEDGGFQVINANGMYLSTSSSADGVNVQGAAESSGQGEVWYFTETEAGTALDFRVDGTQYLGIRTFNISKGNVTETSGYYNIETQIDLPSGGYNLSGGSNYSIGLKVMYVNSYLANAGYLSWDYYNYNRYDDNTVWAVKQFQADQGISADGVVGLVTWKAMGYSEDEWYNLGSYVTDLKVYAYGSSRDTYVNAMLSTAQEYAWAGTGFADGASGTPGTYVDCSGLIYQCLYSAGINPDTNIIDHARVVYEYTSNYLGNDWQMGVAVSYAQPGDLIFYGGSSINHVAIYAGNGMIYDSWPGIGVTCRNMYSGGNILKIVRVF
ncbi:MAG: peptidoglycan-binding protein [Parasporobacterium sp.]|nr:peptidoglycan-binding protein [Parasporobacterium sp.]